MNHAEEQDLLLALVETWRPSATPEYRGFRCANCQEYRNKSWYHWLHSGGYRMPIHMCDETCERVFQNGTIVIAESNRAVVERNTFGRDTIYSTHAIDAFRKIITAWPEDKDPELKAFTCDLCDKELEIDETDGFRKGYHVWWVMDDRQTLAELHFHQSCGQSLDLPNK